MQIGNSIYFDIEVMGMDIENFLTYADILDFILVETAGASLPYIYIKMIIRDEKIKNSFLLNNQLKVSIGENSTNADSFIVDVHNVHSNSDASDIGWLVEVSGFIGNRDYMVEQRTKAYTGNSLFVINDVMKEYFGKVGSGSAVFPYISSDFSSTNENQVIWRQNNTTASYFVTDTILHCDVRPSFPLFSFDRYLNFYIRDLRELVKEEPKYTFTPSPPGNSKELQYFNNFRTVSYKPMYNAQSGYNKLFEIYNSVNGTSSGFFLSKDPILSASSEFEEAETGNTFSVNNIQSANVHDTYNIAFAHNINKLLALSSILGGLDLRGYIKDVHPTDLVRVNLPPNDDPSLIGLYIVDTVVTKVSFHSGLIHTYVFVTRDNKNNVENYVPKKKRDWFKIRKKFMDAVVSNVAIIKNVYASAMRIIDGRFLEEMLSFVLLTKNNVLRSFRPAGVNIDFTSKENLLISLVAEGNSLLNLFCEMIFPEEIAATLRDAIIMGRSQMGTFGGRVESYNTVSLVSNYVDLYVPVEVRSIVMTIVESLYGITDTLNSIAEDNGVAIPGQKGSTVTTSIPETDYITEGQQRANSIIVGFEKNTTGLDIPFPIISLTESQSLLTDNDLKNFLADETIQKLDDLGYLDNVDKDTFKNILLGVEPIDFNIIDAINKSAGNTFAYRFWGTFTSLNDLVSFYIKKSFKDKFRTIPCTKLISALQGANIFFACPSSEEDLRFYINSRRIELNRFEIDLGYKDTYGNPVIYTVYYTETGYNSNSVMLEVKQGGMV